MHTTEMKGLCTAPLHPSTQPPTHTGTAFYCHRPGTILFTLSKKE